MKRIPEREPARSEYLDMTTGPENVEHDYETSAVLERFRNCERVELPKYGTEPVVTGGGNPAAPAVEAYKSLRTRLVKAQESRGIRSVVITSTEHSEGKTLTAFNLACCCSQLENSPVLLVDGDLRIGGLSTLAGATAQRGLREVLGGAAPWASAVVATDLPNLYLMSAGAGDEQPTELLSSAAWGQFISSACESFRLVLIDAPPVGIVADFNLVEAACDGSLVVVRAYRTKQQDLDDCLVRIDAKKLIGVVWNGADRSPEGYSYPYRKA